MYSSLFADLFLYLYLNHYPNDWRAVIVYPTRGMDVGETKAYRELLESRHVKRIYLDELDSATEQSIGIETVKLAKDAIAPEEMVGKRAKELISKARQEIADEVAKRELLQLIKTIIVYKFPQKSREEIEQMLGVSELKQTRVYQEALEEGERKAKLEAVPRLLGLGLSVDQVAGALDLSLKQVRQAANSSPLSEGTV